MLNRVDEIEVYQVCVGLTFPRATADDEGVFSVFWSSQANLILDTLDILTLSSDLKHDILCFFPPSSVLFHLTYILPVLLIEKSVECFYFNLIKRVNSDYIQIQMNFTRSSLLTCLL